MSTSFVNKIFQENLSFVSTAKEICFYQYNHNKIYEQWCSAFQAEVSKIKSIIDFPFLPISFFKTGIVICDSENFDTVFESSGTTRSFKSKHYVKDLNVYIKSFSKCFELFYGDVKRWCIIGLLPSYLQQKNASLVKMVDSLIKESGNKFSGFYLEEFEKLTDVLQLVEHQKQKTLLIGVTYALLDFAGQVPIQLNYTTVMETGGMKGRRKELTRAEVQSILKKRFNIQNVHSEYGMTELLSQAYSKADGRFYCPPWMKVLVRDEEDPLYVRTAGKGLLNIIDLANIYSCSFIATDDVGEVFEDGSFEVYGRMDNTDMRGCSLMVV